jgi:hypothetical protein
MVTQMKLPLTLIPLAILLFSGPLRGQTTTTDLPIRPLVLPSFSSSTSNIGMSSSVADPDSSASISSNSPSYPGTNLSVRHRHVGIDAIVGINGIGGDIAVAVASHFNLRVGGQMFGYSTTFQEEGANVDAHLRIGGGKGSLDWFPFRNGLHLSPTIIFLNQTDIRSTVLVPSGQSVSLGTGNYVSSNADPLHGSGSVGVRKTAPGFTIGYGNIVPRSGKHFSFPVEAGFYYVGQPTLKVTFSGSACEPSLPQPLGCQSVTNDASFQSDLAAFIRRNNNNLSYASFLPILSFGVGYSF